MLSPLCVIFSSCISHVHFAHLFAYSLLIIIIMANEGERHFWHVWRCRLRGICNRQSRISVWRILVNEIFFICHLYAHLYHIIDVFLHKLRYCIMLFDRLYFLQLHQADFLLSAKTVMLLLLSNLMTSSTQMTKLNGCPIRLALLLLPQLSRIGSAAASLVSSSFSSPSSASLSSRPQRQQASRAANCLSIVRAFDNLSE